MRISLRGVEKSDETKVRGLIESAFADPDEIVFEDGPGTSGTVHANIMYFPGDERDRFAVEDILAEAIQLGGYVFCNVAHHDERKAPAAETEEVAYGWPSL